MNTATLIALVTGFALISGCEPASRTAQPTDLADALIIEDLQVEIAYGAEPGTLQATFLDAQLDQAVRLTAATFEAIAWLGSEAHPLLFRAIQNARTGERIGSSARYEAHLDRALSHRPVIVQINSLPVNGRVVPEIVVSVAPDKSARGDADAS